MGGKLNSSQKDAICNKVYRKYPAMHGVRPQVQRQETRKGEQFLLCFHKRITLQDGKSMPSTVRVVASDRGKIIKMTASR